MSGETSQTLGRGLRMLELLAERPSGTTVAELAQELGVGRTVAYRLVATFVEYRFVSRDREGLIRLGWGALVLARAAGPVLRAQALPILRELADSVGATAHLTSAEGEEALAIAVVEPRWTDFHVGYREGSRHLLSRGAAGRAILTARTGDAAIVRTTGELQPGAHGVALAVASGQPVEQVAEVELSVGVVALAALPASADAAVERAARQLHAKLFS